VRCEFINHCESTGEIYYVENFTLTYSGHLPSGNKDSKSEVKHAIRQHFSWQIYNKWQRTKALNDYLQMSPPLFEHRAGQWCKPQGEDDPNPFFRVQKCGLTLYPLVTAHNRLSCELEIWMSVWEPSLLSPSGDIDNRIKVVFDALRLPEYDHEIPEEMRNGGTLYCLLEDDSMIRKFSVEAEESLTSPLVEQLKVTVHLQATSGSHGALLGL
jgi:hypothetical protein